MTSRPLDQEAYPQFGGVIVLPDASCLRDWLLLVPIACLALLPPSASADDGADLKAVVEQFFAAYTKKDLDGFMSLWSTKSPDLALRRQGIQQLFATTEKIGVNSLTIRKVVAEGETSKVRVAVEMSG